MLDAACKLGGGVEQDALAEPLLNTALSSGQLTSPLMSICCQTKGASDPPECCREGQMRAWDILLVETEEGFCFLSGLVWNR